MNGLPVVQSTFDLRFSLSVPEASACPMPAAGYPIVLYAHGTGGDYRSYVADGTGPALTSPHAWRPWASTRSSRARAPARCRGPRRPRSGSIFFNFKNPVAARTNGRQSAIDEVQRARLFTESHLVVPAAVSTTSADILLRRGPNDVLRPLAGRAQRPALHRRRSRGARRRVLRFGRRDHHRPARQDQPPPSVRDLVRTLLGFTLSNAAELNVFHPTMSLFQSLIDVEDPLHYGLLQASEPRAGFAPKSIYMTEGINPDGTGDTYAPPPGIEAHALSIGLPLQLPDEHAIPQVAWGGPQPTSVPPGGLVGEPRRRRGLGRARPVGAAAGRRRPLRRVRRARRAEQAAQFLQDLAANPQGLVPAPALGPTDVDAGACTPFGDVFVPACLDCLSASCCDAAVACFDVPDCFGYVSCQQNCPPAMGGSNGCLDACAQDFPTAQPTLGTMTACLQARCPGECPY